MEVVGYIRVSTDGQAQDGFGLAEQREQIEKYCAEKGYKIVSWEADEGESGAKERPGFDRIIYGDITNPPIQAVVVAKSDRVARDINIYYYYKMMLKKKDMELISVSEDFGSMGMFASMLEAFTMCVAEMERENITRRTSGGRKQKASQGGYSGGKAPVGYKAYEGKLLIDPDEAEIVKYIYKRHKNGRNGREIAEELERLGKVSRSGKPYSASTVNNILRNRMVYKGYYRYGNSGWVKGEQEAIIK